MPRNNVFAGNKESPHPAIEKIKSRVRGAMGGGQVGLPIAVRARVSKVALQEVAKLQEIERDFLGDSL